MRSAERALDLENTHVLIRQFEVALLQAGEELLAPFAVEDVIVFVIDMDDQHSRIVLASRKTFDFGYLDRSFELMVVEIDKSLVRDKLLLNFAQKLII